MPSELIGIDDSLLAWNFDRHVYDIGTRFENLMRQPKMTAEKALRQLNEPRAQRQRNAVGDTIMAMLGPTG